MLRTLTIALCLTMFASRAHADANFEFVDDHSGAMQTRIAVAGQRLRIDAAGTGGAYVVLDLKTQTLTQINPQRRTTTSSSIEEVTQIVRSISTPGDPANQPLLQLVLGSLPPDRRGQLVRVIRQSRRDAAYPFQATGKRERVGELPCAVYEQRPPGGDTRTLCVARYADLALADSDARTLQTAIELLRRTGGPWLPATQVPGLPLRYAGSFDGGAFGGAGHLRQLSQEPLPPAYFDDPPGYRIVSILEMLAVSAPPR